MTPAVELRGINKRFGAVQANHSVNLTVAAGTIHGIVGENGAGKSTLMSILYGFYQADSGSVAIHGAPAQIRQTRDAIALGVGMVHQHFMLVDTLSALDNIMLGAEPHWQLQRARAMVRERLDPLMRDSGLAVALDTPVADLPVGERQRLEILKALYRGARILILDEPTAVLTPAETLALFDTLRGLRARGTTVLLITHKLKEIMALCDAVTVMRGGAVVRDCAIAQTSVDDLAQAMVGRRVQQGREAGTVAREPGTVLLEARDLIWRDGLGVVRLGGSGGGGGTGGGGAAAGGGAPAGVSLSLRAGEIVGIAGVSGNGQSELLDVLCGLRVPQSGSLRVRTAADGAGPPGSIRADAAMPSAQEHHFNPNDWIDPTQARALRIAHVPEDRHLRGLVLPFPAWESAVLGYQSKPRYSLAGWMRGRAMREDTAAMLERYDVRPRNPLLRTSKFSGGNQQKLVLAREAFVQPQVLLVGQPTRGVDIGAIEFIHARLRALRDEGGAVLLVSSELDEVLALADRVIVMNAGGIAGELPIAQCSEAALGRLMGGAAAAPPAVVAHGAVH